MTKKDDHEYQAKAPAVVMEWRTSIEATTTEKENQNDKNRISPIFCSYGIERLSIFRDVDIKENRTNRIQK
jgi:hypothetical protein